MQKPQHRERNAHPSISAIALSVLGLVFALGVGAQLVAKHVTQGPPPPAKAAAKPAAAKTEVAPKAAAAEPAPATAPATAPAPAAAAPAATPAPQPVPAPTSAMTKLALAGGGSIDASGTGVESKLLGFITDAGSQIDKTTWFDFDRLSFETGSAKLTQDSKTQVDNIAAILKAYPAVKIKIGGYTDNVGNPENNQKLSAARARTVAETLTVLGVDAARIEHEGYGEQHAIADNGTPEGRAKNRRISVSVRAK